MSSPIMQVYERAKAWNTLRYGTGRTYDKELTLALLREEFNEWLEAVKSGNPVNSAKELADIVFVALGAISKHGEYVNKVQVNINSLLLSAYGTSISVCHESIAAGLYISTLINLLDVSEDEDAHELLAVIAFMAILELSAQTNSNEITLAVLLAVCDSNDTKSFAPIEANEKGAAKGPGYMPAEPMIFVLLSGVLQ